MTPEERRQQIMIEQHRQSLGVNSGTAIPDDPVHAGPESEALEQRVTMMEDERALRGQEVFVLDEA